MTGLDLREDLWAAGIVCDLAFSRYALRSFISAEGPGTRNPQADESIEDPDAEVGYFHE